MPSWDQDNYEYFMGVVQADLNNRGLLSKKLNLAQNLLSWTSLELPLTEPSGQVHVLSLTGDPIYLFNGISNSFHSSKTTQKFK